MKHSQPYLGLFFFLLSFSFCACSQGDNIERLNATVHYRKHLLGSSSVIVKETRYGKDIPIQFVQLHHNEETADKVTTSLASQVGFDYLQIVNESKRFIEFKLGDKDYKFDPNRIFSKKGIIATLRSRSHYSDTAYQVISAFSTFLLDLLDHSKTIVSVHNNTDGAFSPADYIKNNTGLVFQNPELDPDDFFITTDSIVFEKLKENNFNVVLEYSKDIEDDGSLSVYCGRNNIRYINIEAQHGHAKEQEAMLRTLIQILQ